MEEEEFSGGLKARDCRARMAEEKLSRAGIETAARLACQSLLYEVCTSPKPGLVDRFSNGSHRDMDCFTFMASAAALWPYFARCVKIGLETQTRTPEETFQLLRQPGKRAEETMCSATGGVNTHKGAIFSMGILCAALGRLPREEWSSPARVFAMCARMTKAPMEREFREITPETARTAGQKLYLSHGITGIRGEAANGFPSVKNVGLPTLKRGLALGLSLNRAGCGTLLALLSACADTNMIARSDYETYRRTVAEITCILNENPFPDSGTLNRLDRAFTARNLSPGGSADLLAITYFLYFLEQL